MKITMEYHIRVTDRNLANRCVYSTTSVRTAEAVANSIAAILGCASSQSVHNMKFSPDGASYVSIDVECHWE